MTRTVVLLGLAIALVSAGCNDDGATTRGPTASAGTVNVVRIVDGDTIRVIIDGSEDRVRLIGIDSPESAQRECFAAEATAELERLLADGVVRMEGQRSERDRFDRLLRDLYRPRDGLFVNAEMVRTGHARTLEVRPDLAHAEEFRQLEADARSAGRGLWGACPR